MVCFHAFSGGIRNGRVTELVAVRTMRMFSRNRDTKVGDAALMPTALAMAHRNQKLCDVPCDLADTGEAKGLTTWRRGTPKPMKVKCVLLRVGVTDCRYFLRADACNFNCSPSPPKSGFMMQPARTDCLRILGESGSGGEGRLWI